MEIKSIILAAGKGTRMKSDIPKVLHEITGKPLLGYVLDNISELSAETFVVTGHQAEKVEAFVKNKYPNTKTVLQNPQSGTGHAVSTVCPHLENFDGIVLILCGDTPLITSATMKKFVEFHLSCSSDLTVMSAVLENPANYGRIIRDSDNSLKCIVEEKDASADEKNIQEINAGIYCINWQKIKPAFSMLTSNNAQNEYYLTDVVSWGKSQKLNVNVYVLENNEEIYGINSRKNLIEAADMLNKRKQNFLIENGVTIIDPSSTWISDDTEIGFDTIIYPFTYIEGKNKIGKNCKIGPFTHFRGEVCIADNCKIGNFVEIKKAKIAGNTNACHLSYIGDSDIGSHVNIGAGTITANYNPVTKIKSKTVIHNNVKIGANSVLVAPVEVEESANVGACSVIGKKIPAFALAITRAPLKIIDDWGKKNK